jgi:hypothetical protein
VVASKKKTLSLLHPRTRRPAMAWVPSSARAPDLDEERDILNDEDWDWWGGRDGCAWNPAGPLSNTPMDTADFEVSSLLPQAGADASGMSLAVKRKFDEHVGVESMGDSMDDADESEGGTASRDAHEYEAFSGAENTQHMNIVHAPGQALPFEAKVYRLAQGKRAACSLGRFATAEEAALDYSQWRHERGSMATAWSAAGTADGGGALEALRSLGQGHCS